MRMISLLASDGALRILDTFIVSPTVWLQSLCQKGFSEIQFVFVSMCFHKDAFAKIGLLTHLLVCVSLFIKSIMQK